MQDNTRARNLPLLDNIRIASPCSESWEGMEGDERVRFCGGCSKFVYNLSSMTEREAQDLIAGNEGRLCVRLYRRKDGTVLTSDCEVGVRRKRVTKIAAAALAFGGAGLALAAIDGPGATLDPEPTKTARVRHGREGVATDGHTSDNDGPSWLEQILDDDDEQPVSVKGEMVRPPQPLMGAIAPMPSQSAPPPPPPPRDAVPKL
jgi:hypothetical protein